MKHFIHSGDLGDVLYSLPTIKAMGGGILHLVDQNVGQLHGMSRERALLLAPLLMAQPYVHAVRYDLPTYQEYQTAGVNLNAFRFSGQDFIHQHLADCVGKTFGLPDGMAEEPWLTCQFPIRHAAVIVSRSSRYHNPRFPWRRVLEKYRGFIAFIGTPEEHAALNTEFDADIPHLLTENLRWVSIRIAGADLFIGNQSAPLAIAEGLGIPIVCEVCPASPNCNLKRPNFTAGWDENVILPDLEELIHARKEICSAS